MFFVFLLHICIPKWVILSRVVNLPTWVILSRVVNLPRIYIPKWVILSRVVTVVLFAPLLLLVSGRTTQPVVRDVASHDLQGPFVGAVGGVVPCGLPRPHRTTATVIPFMGRVPMKGKASHIYIYIYIKQQKRQTQVGYS